MPKDRTTGIEWTEHTWNPFVGCSVVSAGCTNCYAMRQADRLVRLNADSVYAGTVNTNNGKPVWNGTVRKATPATWRKPVKIKTPSLFFVNSMSDFFHEAAPDDWRTEALRVMASTPHQYQILTKRPAEILGYLERTGVSFPSNAWIGVTVERADVLNRIDILREVPAAIRFISAEPLLGPLDLINLIGIHWVIGGGESGPGARVMMADWVRGLRDECVRQGVAFFFKQWGRLDNNPLYLDRIDAGGSASWARKAAREDDPNGKGGSKIDGREWKDWPNYLPQQPLL